jgi:uncharacterized protein (DUF2236 family)
MSFLSRSDYSQIVSAEALEGELRRVRASSIGNAEGVFGPRSLTWQIDRESAIFFGAGRALLLQLAHPWVAAAIQKHSDALADPVGRFHRTFCTVFAMVFGTLDQSMSAARRLHRRHASITGQLPRAAGPFSAGSSYSANAIPALCWVYATLIETALVAYELVLPPLTPQQREQYYRESQLFAALFGVPKECLPQNWTAFSAYFSAMVQSDTLSVSDETCSMARRLISGADLWLPIPTSYQGLTIALLPPAVRKRFGFSLGTQKRDIDGAIALTRRFYRFLPARLRYVGPYQEAQQRLAGKTAPDFVTRISNRFWIGCAELPAGDF